MNIATCQDCTCTIARAEDELCEECAQSRADAMMEYFAERLGGNLNINGTCPHCNANLDGDLVIDYPLSQGRSREEALAYAAMYAGWDEHGEANRWGRAIALYCMDRDRTTAYRCPDCQGTWERE